eukprot:m.297650 g.297650  ORF g.297650 m.297650 type:complete len:458 (+) comp13667_c0_seq1:1123-2496(+)
MLRKAEWQDWASHLSAPPPPVAIFSDAPSRAGAAIAEHCGQEGSDDSKQSRRRKVVIDCDAGVDDCTALLLALGNPDFEVVAITCVSGNVELPQVAHNVARILSASSRTDIPFFLGAARPLVEQRRNAQFFHGHDGLGDVPLGTHEQPSSKWPAAQREPAVTALTRLFRQHLCRVPAGSDPHGIRAQLSAFQDAQTLLNKRLEQLAAALASGAEMHVEELVAVRADVELCRDWIQAASTLLEDLSPDEDLVSTLELLALGPLTNLALAQRLDPAFALTLRSLFIMGGTMRAEGNVPGHPACEFNLSADPESAAVVLSEFPHKAFVTWELCLQMPIPWSEVDTQLGSSHLVDFHHRVWQHSRALCEGHGWEFISCDACAAALFMHPRLVTEAALCHSQMVLGGESRGQLVLDRNSLSFRLPNAFIILQVDLSGMLTMLRDALVERQQSQKTSNQLGST